MPAARGVTWAKIRVTFVTAVALIILGVLVYLLTGGTIFQKQATLYLYIPDATGLGQGSPVRADGIDIGKVKSIRLSGLKQPEKVVKLTLSVRRSALPKLPADSSAQISSETAVGDKFVDITTGQTLKRLGPGGVIAYREEANVFKGLDLRQFRKTLDSVNETLAEIENPNTRLGHFVLGDQMYSQMLNKVTTLERSLRKVAATTGSLGHELYTDQLYMQLREPFLQLDRTLAQIQSGQGSLGQMLRNPAQYEKLRADIGSIQNSIAQLRSGPLLQSDELYESWNRGLVSLIQTVDSLNATPLLRTSEMYDNLNGAARTLDESIRDFLAHPKEYLTVKLF